MQLEKTVFELLNRAIKVRGNRMPHQLIVYSFALNNSQRIRCGRLLMAYIFCISRNGACI